MIETVERKKLEVNDLLKLMDNEIPYTNSDTNRLYASQLFQCGYRYRNEQGKPIKIDGFKGKRGNAIEYMIYKEIKSHPEYSDYFYNHKKEFLFTFIGDKEPRRLILKPDLINFKEKHIIEIKSVQNMDYVDVYLRQLKAYLYYFFGIEGTGNLWVYSMPDDKLFQSIDIRITDDDIRELDNQLRAFEFNKYVDGIENSLCPYCNVSDCPIKKTPNYVNLVRKNESVLLYETFLW